MDDLELELKRIELSLEREEFDSALSSLEELKTRFPDYRDSSLAYLVAFYNAQAIFRKEMQATPDPKRLIKAKELFEDSIALGNAFAPSHYLEALLSMALSKYSDSVYFNLDAKYHLETALSIDPKFDSESKSKLALANHRLKDIFDITLCSNKEEMVSEWKSEFKRFPWISIVYGDILKQKADAIVSPANSFGFMDGGLDYYLSKYFGSGLQERLQKTIRKEYDGELLVGQAVVLETGNKSFPYLVSAPTMRVPMDISGTINPYLAALAAFTAVEKFNSDSKRINSILVPGMGTGVGKVPFDIAARQMRTAYEHAVLKRKAFPESIGDSMDMQNYLLKKS